MKSLKEICLPLQFCIKGTIEFSEYLSNIKNPCIGDVWVVKKERKKENDKEVILQVDIPMVFVGDKFILLKEFSKYVFSNIICNINELKINASNMVRIMEAFVNTSDENEDSQSYVYVIACLKSMISNINYIFSPEFVKKMSELTEGGNEYDN